jgi:nucleoside-diphosphate-sugar epimerase
VAVVGATGIIGRIAVPALERAGHEVVVLADGLEHDGLVAAFTGADAVCSFVPPAPSGLGAALLRPWQQHDRRRTDGVRRAVRAAREAHVRRLVHESVSFQYADQGDGWISEHSPLEITSATEPASVAESYVQAYSCESRVAVVLRFGTVLGDHPRGGAERGRTSHRGQVRLGAPGAWVHVVHRGDVGPAVLAALGAPSGIYNVGAEPVRRSDLVHALAAAGRDRTGLFGPLVRRMHGARVEPLTRSLRVSSASFTAHTGWTPSWPEFDESWLEAAALTDAVP